MSNPSKPNSTDYLTVNNLNWQVDDTLLLSNIDLSVRQGEFIGIVGPNGAGKTSLLRCIANRIQHHTGQIQLNQRLITDYSAKELAQQMALVAQSHQAIFSLDTYEVVRMGLVPHKALFATDTKADIQLIAEAIEKVGLTQLKQHQFHTLSGGEQQRAYIAQALVQQANVLLMDEPTNHLDIYYQHQVMLLVQALVKQLKVTVLMTVHDMNLAAQYCERLVMMQQGQIIADGPTVKVLTSERLTNTFELPCEVDTHPLTGKPRVSFAPQQLMVSK